MSKKKVTKYRISLPPDIISHLVSLAKKDSSTLSIEALKILIPVQAKIDADVLVPAYITNPKPDLFEQLGFESPDTSFIDSVSKANKLIADLYAPNLSIRNNNGLQAREYIPNIYEVHQEEFLTKEDYWEACYKKHQKYPDHCTIRDLEAAKEHMYLNGLMTPEEIKEFEENI